MDDACLGVRSGWFSKQAKFGIHGRPSLLMYPAIEVEHCYHSKGKFNDRSCNVFPWYRVVPVAFQENRLGLAIEKLSYGWHQKVPCQRADQAPNCLGPKQPPKRFGLRASEESKSELLPENPLECRPWKIDYQPCHYFDSGARSADKLICPLGTDIFLSQTAKPLFFTTIS